MKLTSHINVLILMCKVLVLKLWSSEADDSEEDYLNFSDMELLESSDSSTRQSDTHLVDSDNTFEEGYNEIEFSVSGRGKRYTLNHCT